MSDTVTIGMLLRCAGIVDEYKLGLVCGRIESAMLNLEIPYANDETFPELARRFREVCIDLGLEDE